MAAFGQLFYCIGNSVGIPYTAKASKLAGMRTAAYNVDVASDRRRRKNVQGTFFVLEIIKMSTQIKKRLTIEKDMAILFSYVVNKINRIIMQKMHWRYLRIAGIA